MGLQCSGQTSYSLLGTLQQQAKLLATDPARALLGLRGGCSTYPMKQKALGLGLLEF